MFDDMLELMDGNGEPPLFSREVLEFMVGTDSFLFESFEELEREMFPEEEF